jgi:L-ascorbate metabolism protein UlaG (beta-lactamase superfamily)
MKASYIGHASLLLEIDGVTFLTDPVLRKRVAHLKRQHPLPLMPDPDVILLSHHHMDHMDFPSLRRLGHDKTIIAAPGTSDVLRRKGFSSVIDLAPGERMAVEGLEVQATKAVHEGSRHKSWPVESVGFLLKGSKQVYFAGDTDLFPEIGDEAFGSDLALLPVWGWGPNLGQGHMNPERAARALSLIASPFAIPIHWGTFFPLGLVRFAGKDWRESAEKFRLLASEHAPGSEVRILQPGESSAF